MATAVGIANIALNNLGDRTITAFSDKTAQATSCSNRFSDVVNQVLRSHPWNCMTKRATLAKYDLTPVYLYDYAYVLPSDALRVVSLKEEEDYDYAWRIEVVDEGGTDKLALVTDASSANIRYIRKYIGGTNHDVANSGIDLFDPLLVQAIGLALASEIAMDLTGRSELRDLMLAKYSALLSEARSINAQEGTAKVIESNEWLNARTQYSTGGYFKPFSASTSGGVT
jgi:hypothetical protein